MAYEYNPAIKDLGVFLWGDTKDTFLFEIRIVMGVTSSQLLASEEIEERASASESMVLKEIRLQFIHPSTSSPTFFAGSIIHPFILTFSISIKLRCLRSSEGSVART